MSQVALQPAINLSYWLYKVHPEIFRALLPSARSKPTLGRLGQDGTDNTEFFPGISEMPADNSSFDIAPGFDTGSTPVDISQMSTSDISNAISPDLLNMPPPQLDTVSFDVNSMPTPDLVSAADVAAATPLAPSTASTVGAVAGVLTAGLSGLAAITTAMYKAGTAQSQTIGTQASRVAAGGNPAPITYGYNSAGQLVPILQSSTTGPTPLTPTALSNLGMPSTWSPYIVPIAIVVIAALLGSRKR